MRLPAPNNNIIITPPRPSDADVIVAIMNDDRVAMKFSIPPYPYLREHAVSYLEADAERHRDAVEEGHLFSECPVQSIREVKDDGEEIFIGEARLVRSKYYNVRDEDEAKRLAQSNSERPIGDPEILWTFSDYLAPSHHGKGIMSATIKVVMGWAIPNMGVQYIVAIALPSNAASIRVFAKNGFTHFDTIMNFKRLTESRGGQMYSIYIMEWRKPVVGAE